MTVKANASTEELAREAVEHGAVQKPRELRWFMDYLLHSQPIALTSVLEIGCKDGGMLWLWHQLCAQVIGIDLNPIPHMDGVETIVGDSHTTKVDGDFDLVFIDGDHSYEGVKADWLTYRHMPLVAFHDIVPKSDGRAVHRLWAELKRNHRTAEFIDPGPEPVRGETLTREDGGIGLVLGA